MGHGITHRGVAGAALLAAAIASARAELPLRATFAVGHQDHTWTLAQLNRELPSDWTPYEFLVIEFRASSSQRFDLGIETAAGRLTKRIAPMPNVWVRAAIPLRFYREPAGSAIDLAATYNQPRGSYWINIGNPRHGPTTGVRGLTVSMEHPVGTPTLEVRSATLANTDPGDAVLEGAPVVDEFGQYVRVDWPGKARSLEALRAAWAAEEKDVAAPLRDRCPYGGFARTRAEATGFFRVQRDGDRWWFVCPDGHLFFSSGVNGVGTASGTRVAGREYLFAALPPATIAGAGGANFYGWNLLRRHGDDWRPRWAELAAKRLQAWGLNSIHYWGPRNLQPGAEPRVPYAQMLRGWQTDRSIMGMPDVYAADFAQRVEEAASRQLSPLAHDPWMLGYFIGNEPPWPGRESQLVNLILAGPAGEMQARLKAHLAEGDSPDRRKAFVHAAFERYLDIINAAVRKHAPRHLNLGIRFGGSPEGDLVTVTRGFDVFSLNVYAYAPRPSLLNEAHTLMERPILIGEFHIGVPERGLAPGLVQAMNQDERAAAYRYYVEQSAAHPAVIGTHWFQWLDQPATGRFDGENYAIGFIDVADRPYAELVHAAKLTHTRLLDVHAGRTPPFGRQPKANQGN